jgi:bifunctional DNase/RNase
LLEVEVDSVNVNLLSTHRVVLLRQLDGERYLPIWIGHFEADAIALELGGASVARPLTHDLLREIIGHFGASVKHVVINGLTGNTFYARIVLEVDGKVTDVDSRPSDAIALAVRTKSPVYVSEEVMDEAAIVESPDVGSGVAAGEAREEEEGLGAFRDFVDSLDLD